MNCEFSADRLTGFADEGAPSIGGQIAVHQELDWRTIELRNIDGQNICEIDDRSFDEVCAAMDRAGFTASAFGSAIANWARPITTPFERDTEDLRRAVPRMRRLHTRLIRVMSYPNAGLPEAEWKREAVKRMRELSAIADGEGVVLALENCDGWASSSPMNLGEFMTDVGSSALKIVFDSGNAISHGGNPETNREFFRAALPHIVHFHVKDCRPGPDGKPVYTMPGKGSCEVESLINRILASGYTGLFSIEPHIAAQIHLGNGGAEGSDPCSVYLAYGKEMKALWKRVLGQNLSK